MGQLLDIEKVVIGPDAFTTTLRLADGAPLFTSDAVEATARIYWLMPHIAEHVCVGDGGKTFQDVMGDTSLAHLLEHVTIEILSQTGMAGDIAHARTRALDEPRTFEIQFACPDDVLVASALSSAAWVLEWAYGAADEDSKPNTEAIVEGIVSLTRQAFTMEGNEAPPAQEEAMEMPPPSPSATGSFTVPEIGLEEPLEEVEEEALDATGEFVVPQPQVSGMQGTGELVFDEEVQRALAHGGEPLRPHEEPPQEEPLQAAGPEVSSEPGFAQSTLSEADALAGLDLVIHHAEEAEYQAQTSRDERLAPHQERESRVDRRAQDQPRSGARLPLQNTVGFMDITDDDPLGGGLN